MSSRRGTWDCVQGLSEVQQVPTAARVTAQRTVSPPGVTRILWGGGWCGAEKFLASASVPRHENVATAEASGTWLTHLTMEDLGRSHSQVPLTMRTWSSCLQQTSEMFLSSFVLYAFTA